MLFQDSGLLLSLELVVGGRGAGFVGVAAGSVVVLDL
jgi:hypothetical protein